jgi:hypothetical protein
MRLFLPKRALNSYERVLVESPGYKKEDIFMRRVLENTHSVSEVNKIAVLFMDGESKS